MIETIHIETLKIKWRDLLLKFKDQFGEEPAMENILFLIGVQELGKGYRNFSRDEKMELMHIATCRLLSGWGYYEKERVDEEGWPHWRLIKQLPQLTLGQQEILLRQAVVTYFEEAGF